MIILKLTQDAHILAFIDRSRALGWMHKASFDSVYSESHNAVARWLYCTLVSNKKFLYSQHIKVT